MTHPSFIPTATQRFRDYINLLMRVIATYVTMGLPHAVAGPLGTRLCLIRQRFLAIVARLEAGTPPMSRRAGHRRSAPAGPRPPSLLPRHRGWLRPLLPTEAAPLSGYLHYMLRAPDMAALVEAAPALRRDLRSLCWMLALTPPPALARPPRPAKPKADKPPPAPKTPKPTQPAPPQGPWRRIPSAQWPKGVMDRRRRKTA